jgi:predicted  nucleic acid-binding Zn-ribbon protein
MAELTSTEIKEIYELQKKLFTTSTENNPYLQNSTINPDLSKGLNTDSKTIVGAINDIFSLTTSVRETNADFIDRFNRIIGNEELNPKLAERLSKLGDNFYDALYNAWQKANSSEQLVNDLEFQIESLKSQLNSIIGGTFDTDIIINFQRDVDNLKNQVKSIENQIEDSATSISANSSQIQTLKTQIKELSDRLDDTVPETGDNSEIEEIKVQLQNLKTQIENISIAGNLTYFYEESLASIGNKFTISYKPVSINAISIFINGVYYNNECFKFSNNNKTISWLHSDDFELSASSDEIIVKYSSYEL